MSLNKEKLIGAIIAIPIGIIFLLWLIAEISDKFGDCIPVK